MDTLTIAGRTLASRLIVGTGKYPDPAVMLEAIRASGAEMVTVAVRRVDIENPDRDDILRIVDLQLARLNELLAERGLELDVSPEAKQRLAAVGYDPAFGARPLRRAIQRMVQDPLAMQLLEGRLAPGERVRVDVEASELVFHRTEPVQA